MNRTQAACRFSIARLFSPKEDLFDGRPWEAPKFCYLHTLTFADPEPSEKEARRRWKSFISGFVLRTKKFGVMVVERGEKTGRLHYHLVTSERWDAAEMWRVLPKYGFGRYDVRQRPVERAAYAAKYVGKAGRFRIAGRRWSCFGFKGCRVRDVEVTRTKRTLVADLAEGLRDWKTWRVHVDDGPPLIVCIRLRPDAIGPATCDARTSRGTVSHNWV